MTHRLLFCLACLALLTACQGGPAPAAAPPIEAALNDADAALRAGQRERAIDILAVAARAHPADKTPLLRIAQMRFDEGDYGSAIVHANAALRREPDNLLASSIVAVSGLRVASKALGELARRNNLTGNVRNEAEDLAKLLRASLGEEILVPAHGAPHAVAGRARPAAVAPGTPGPRAGGSDPFTSLTGK
jgi:hypothetical protein